MNATNTGLDFSTTKTGTTMNVDAAGMTNVSKMEFTNPTVAAPGIQASGSISLSDGGKITGNPAQTTTGAGTITGQVVITSGAVTDTFVMGSNAANTISGNTNTININSNDLSSLIAAIANETGAGKLGGANLNVAAIQDVATGGIFLQGTVANVALSVDTTQLTDVMTEGKANGSVGNPIVNAAIPDQVVFGTGSTNSATDVASGHIVIKNSGGTNVNTTFVMGGSAYNSSNAAATGLGTNTVTVNGNTLADLARAINADSTGAYAGANGVDLIATASDNKGLTVQAATQADVLSNYSSTLQDQYSLSSGVANAGRAASAATFASASLGTGQKISGGAELNGAIVLNNGGVNYTFTMANSSAGSTATSINTSAMTLAALADAISQSGIGVQANVDSNGVLQMQSTNQATTISVVGSPTLTDTQQETLTGGTGSAGTPATPASASQATINLVGGGATALSADVLHGSITLTGANGSETFQMGGTGSGNQTTGGTIAVGSDSTPFSENLGALAAAITGDTALGITAQVTTHGLSLTMNTNVNTPIGASGSGLTDTSSAYSKATMSLGSFDSQNDTLSGGTVSFSVGGQAESIAVGPGNVSNLMSTINGASKHGPIRRSCHVGLGTQQGSAYGRRIRRGRQLHRDGLEHHGYYLWQVGGLRGERRVQRWNQQFDGTPHSAL